MLRPQFVGLGVTALVVVGVDLRIDWLMPLAVLAGGVATYAASLLSRTR
jgi:ABC-type Fe3+-siderophore transport system permease subunit